FIKQIDKGNGFSYLPKSKVILPSMTACAMLTRQYLEGGDLTTGPTTRGWEVLKAEPPSAEKYNMYYYSYATQVVFNMRGEPWKFWNPRMRELLIQTQDKGTKSGQEHQKGSWAPGAVKFDRRGGRLMCTSLALLTLEVYYRHTPLN